MDGIETASFQSWNPSRTPRSSWELCLPGIGKVQVPVSKFACCCAQNASLRSSNISSIYVMAPSPLSQHNPRTHLGHTIWSQKLTQFHRSSHRIPGHRPPSAHRGKPSAQAVPDENLCTKYRGCKVSFLVLLDEAPKGQEGERRDCELERGT